MKLSKAINIQHRRILSRLLATRGAFNTVVLPREYIGTLSRVFNPWCKSRSNLRKIGKVCRCHTPPEQNIWDTGADLRPLAVILSRYNMIYQGGMRSWPQYLDALTSFASGRRILQQKTTFLAVDNLN